jgi:NADPH:quinone reductase-like Zn-dependent oxidoreductase
MDRDASSNDETFLEVKALAKIKKVVITAYGDESVLAVVEAELPEPAAGEVQLAVEYSLVSGSDVNMRRGTYPLQKKPPLTPGYSVVGTVLVNGNGCSKFRVGDRVACLSKYEGQAERINLPEKYLVPVPDGLDGGEAVALVLDWVTAYEMLYRSAKVKVGQKIFVHGLSGGVGGALLRLGIVMGVKVYGTASTKKHEELRALGVVPFDYGNKDWIGAMQGVGGVDAVFDALGYESFDESYSILKKGGVLVGYGQNLPAWTGGPERNPVPMILKLFARNLAVWTGKKATFFGVMRGSKYFSTDLATLFDWLKDGKISVPVKARFGLDEIKEAHRAYAASAGMGSIVIEVAGR